MALTPGPLQQGSRLAALSPAGPVGRDEVERGIAILADMGLEVETTPNAFAEEEYLAGSDAQRLADLAQAFQDDSIDGVICTRGGYGSARLLPLIDFADLEQHPKPFIGFSDITALQNSLWQKLGWVTYSGPQVARGFGGKLDAWSRERFREMLFGEAWGVPLPIPEGQALRPISSGRAEGPLLGGNLAILASLCGTPFQPSFDSAIAVIEEIDEPTYRIDRMLTQLIQSGVFAGVNGVLLGSFRQHVKDEQFERSGSAERILNDVLPEIPILANAPYGHVETRWTLPIGAWTTLNTETATVTVEPAR